MEVNQQVYDREAERYAVYELMAPERALLQRLRGRWADIDMLDLGMGGGRTSFTFSALTRSYVGVDYSPRLVELARANVGEDERTRFVLGDARELPDLADAGFDLVLFSYNGIDSIGHEDRLRVLAEARRLVRDDGLFCFSAHNLRALPWGRELVKPRPRAPVTSTLQFVRSVRKTWRMAQSNRRMDRAHIERHGWALIDDMGHGWQLELYYVMPEQQVAQLASAGFAVQAILDQAGREVQLASRPHDPWLHYLCTPA